MPKYKKKITRLMDYEEFKEAIQNYRDPKTGKPLSSTRKAFLAVLFFSACRISEALALNSNDIHCTPDTIYFSFFRLKGSKQTDPLPLPRTDTLLLICGQEGKLFDFSRSTGYRIVKRVFPILYPHYFRMNRFTKVAEKHGLATMINFSGLAPTSVSHYIAKVDIKTVGKALREEIG